MRNLRVIEFLSLDGVMQAPGSPEEPKTTSTGGVLLTYRQCGSR